MNGRTGAKLTNFLQYNSILKIQMQNKNRSTPCLRQLLEFEFRYWVANLRISVSINFMICKHFAVDLSFELASYKQSVSQLNQHIENVGKSKDIEHIVIEWINSLLFNIVALNHEYKEEISSSISSVSDNSEANIELMDGYDSSCRQAVHMLFNMPAIPVIIGQMQLSPPAPVHQLLHRAHYTLLSSLNYLANKLDLKLDCHPLLADKLSALSGCSCSCAEDELDDEIRIKINEVLFGTQSRPFQLLTLRSMLTNSYNMELLNLASLVDANFYRYEVTRPIFSGCSISGNELVAEIVKSLANSSSKNELFSQSMQETDRLLQLFLAILQYRSLNSYACWINIVCSYIQSKQREGREEDIVKQICNFLRSLPSQHQQLFEILRVVMGELMTRSQCSQSVALQIVKKLLVNRFLLSPDLFYSYSGLDLSSEQLNSVFNHIRLYFYPKKAQLESHKKYSPAVESILLSTMELMNNNIKKGKYYQHAFNQVNTKHVIYKLDRSLHQDYRAIGELISQAGPGNSLKRPDKSMSSQCSELSFSFLKNNFAAHEQVSKKVLQSPNLRLDTPRARPEINPESLRHFQTTMSKDENMGNFVSPTSAKSNKTDITDIPLSLPDAEMHILEQLLAKRRALCQARSLMDQRQSRRTQQRQKMKFYLAKVHAGFESVMRGLEEEANRVRINSSSI